jgi:eukaryotic-like serine/threonine-protein kinase
MVGGYRLVRKLGFGARAEVFLGAGGSGDSGAVAAIKVFRPSTPDDSIDTEIEALTRLDSRHITRLADVSWDRNRKPCLVLEKVGPGTLARLLIERGGIEPGEAVTILAPLVETVAELHRAGVAHGALRLSNVLFDDAGAPVLVGFGGAVLLGPAPGRDGHGSLTPAQLAESEAVAADLAALALLCRSVLQGTRDVHALPAAGALFACLDASRGLDAAGFPREIAERLFDLAEPIAVRSAPRADDAPAQGRILEPSPSSLDLPQPESGKPAGAVAPVLKTLRRWLSSVRRPVWFAGALAAALLVVSLVSIPPAGSSSASDIRPEDAKTKTPVTVPAAVQGDDPVKAVLALLAVRAECLRTASGSCLRSVDQDGSATLEDDTRLITSGRTPGADDLLGAVKGATLIQRLGDSALIALQLAGDGQSMPLLAIRTDGGWRIRDLAVG